MILYSKGKNTLCEDLGCDIEEVNRIFDNVFGAYPVMKQWMDDILEKAYTEGCLDNIYGRRRRLPDLKLPKFTIEFTPHAFTEVDEQYYRQYYSSAMNNAFGRKAKQEVIDNAKKHGITIVDNESKIKASERKVVNYMIQSSSAIMTKKAMLNIYHNKRLREMGCKLVLSIHD